MINTGVMCRWCTILGTSINDTSGGVVQYLFFELSHNRVCVVAYRNIYSTLYLKSRLFNLKQIVSITI